MKSNLFSTGIFIFLLMASGTLNAWHTPSPQPAHSSTRTSTCGVPIAQVDLDINNVRAKLLNAGDMWWDLNIGKYEVPKGLSGSTVVSPQAIFAGAIWISALDQGSNLKAAAQTYRQGGGTDYFSGPLDNNGAISNAACAKWDQHFNVLASEITPLVQAFAGSGSVPSSLITSNLQNWPGHGNTHLASQGFDVSGVLAPFFDANGDGIYNPADGDYPTLRQSGQRPAQQSGCDAAVYTSCSAYADQMIFWVMNDVGNTHTVTNCGSLGVQINALAFAFQANDEINDASFYTYNFINKSGAALNHTYISQWTDVDLGCANNDRIGCDTTRHMAIAYNGSLNDAGSVCPTTEVGYGTDIPMLGVQMLEGPRDTNVHYDSTLHTSIQDERLMTCFNYFNINGGSSTGDPYSSTEYRNYQTGYWKNGTPITALGNGYQNSSIRINYTFPGNPSVSTEWSECNPQYGSPIPFGDRRFLQTAGPFTFMPCAQQFMTLAVLFVKPAGGVGLCPSWSVIGTVADKAKTLFDNCFHSIAPGAVSEIQDHAISFYPNPVSSALHLHGSGAPFVNMVMVYDLTGRMVMSQSGAVESIDMTKLPEGLYFVKAITIERSESTFKIVKR